MPACEPLPPAFSCFCHLLSDFGFGSRTGNLDSSLSAFLFGAFAPAVLAASCVLSLTLHLQTIPSSTSRIWFKCHLRCETFLDVSQGEEKIGPWL